MLRTFQTRHAARQSHFFACLSSHLHSLHNTLSPPVNKHRVRLTSIKLSADSSISCRHPFCSLGWPFNCLALMHNFVLYRLVADSTGGCRPKIGLWTEKPYKIHDFHSNPCRHSLENVGWPTKLYQSTQNFMLYRLVTDSRGGVGQK